MEIVKDDRRWCVYMHTSPSNKKYVGITCKKPENRWGPNGNGYMDQIKMKRAINKYGWENFKHEILYTNLTESEASILEMKLIKEYKLTDKRFGYNTSSGKGMEPTYKHNIKVICLNTLEVFNSIREAEIHYNINKGRISSNCKGNCRFAGHDKDGNLLSWAYYDSTITYTKIDFVPRSIKKVICLNTLEVFNSTGDASLKTGIPAYKIRNCCKNNFKYGGIDNDGNGYVLEWYNEGKTYIKQSITKEEIRKSKQRGKLFCNKPVICVNTNEVFKSISIAAKAYGLQDSKISLVCNGKRKTTGKHPITGERLVWRFYAS